MVSIYALGSVSGGHFNPAVSFAIFISGAEKDFVKTITYMCAQLTGGIFAGLVYCTVYQNNIPLGPGKVSADDKADTFSMGSVAGVEVLYTFVLCFVVLRAAVKTSEIQKECETFALAIGFVVVAGGYAAGWVSGGCFNPAVAVGISVSSTVFGGAMNMNVLLYTMFELIGAMLAVALHKLLESDGYSDLAKKCISEFFGTYVLVATVGLTVLCPKDSAGALPIAASLMVMIYALGMVSGANFNPAVSVTLVAAQKMDAGLLGPYIVSQVLGGLAGAGTYTGITGQGVPLGPQKIGGKDDTYSWVAVSFAEVTYTFLLCFVVLNVATLVDTDHNGKRLHMLQGGKAQQIYGLAIGFCVIVGGFAIGGISGGSLNPAVSIGLDMTSKPSMNSAIYAILEIIGGCVAAGLFYIVRDDQFHDEIDRALKKDPENYGALDDSNA
jgi:aquaporin Z